MLKERNAARSHLALGVLAALILAGPLGAAPSESTPDGPVDLQTDALPKSPEEFTEWRTKTALTPEGGAMVFLVAMHLYVSNERLGMQCLTIALDRTQLSKSSDGYQGFRPNRSQEYLIGRLRTQKHLPLAYVVGTKPADGYRASLPFRFRFSRNRYSVQSNRDIKVFVETAGGVRPRPVTLRRNERGHWKVVEASSLFVSVPAPAAVPDDEL